MGFYQRTPTSPRLVWNEDVFLRWAAAKCEALNITTNAQKTSTLMGLDATAAANLFKEFMINCLDIQPP